MVCPVCLKRDHLPYPLRKLKSLITAPRESGFNLLTPLWREEDLLGLKKVNSLCKCGFAQNILKNPDFSLYFLAPPIPGIQSELLEAGMKNFEINLESEQYSPVLTPIPWMTLFWKEKISSEAPYQTFIETVRKNPNQRPLKPFAYYFVLSDEFKGFFEEIWGSFRAHIRPLIWANPDPTLFPPILLDKSSNPNDEDLIQGFFLCLCLKHHVEFRLDFHLNQLKTFEQSVESERINFLTSFQIFQEDCKRGGLSTLAKRKGWDKTRKAWQTYLKFQRILLMEQFSIEILEFLKESPFYKPSGLLGTPALDFEKIQKEKIQVGKGLTMNLTNLVRKFILSEFVLISLDIHLEREKKGGLFKAGFENSTQKNRLNDFKHLHFFRTSGIQSEDLCKGEMESSLLNSLAVLMWTKVIKPDPVTLVRRYAETLGLITSHLYFQLKKCDPDGVALFQSNYKTLKNQEKNLKDQVLAQLFQEQSGAKGLDFEFQKFSGWTNGRNYLNLLRVGDFGEVINCFWLWGLYEFYLKENRLLTLSPYQEIIKSFMIQRKIMEVNLFFEVEEGGLSPEELWKNLTSYLKEYRLILDKEKNPRIKILLELSLLYHPLERILLTLAKEIIDSKAHRELDPFSLPGARDFRVPEFNRYSYLFFCGYLHLKMRDFTRAREVFGQFSQHIQREKNKNLAGYQVLYDLLFELTRGFQTSSNLYVNLSQAEIYSHTQQMLKPNYFPNIRCD